ncbi:hypothetical protein MRX96_037744 [Rhipicephalus microplus]
MPRAKKTRTGRRPRVVDRRRPGVGVRDPRRGWVPSENDRALRKKTGRVLFMTPHDSQTTAVLPTLPSHRGFFSGGVSAERRKKNHSIWKRVSLTHLNIDRFHLADLL